MGTFGTEFVRISDPSLAGPAEQIELDATRIIAALNGTAPSYLYFDRQFPIRSDLLPSAMVEGRLRRVLEFPAWYTVWFSGRGRLVLPDDVVLIFRGSIRADRSMIIELPEVSNLLRGGSSSRVIFAGDRVDTIYPEWFGVLPAPTASAVGGGRAAPSGSRLRRNARALQACVRAACRDRVSPEDGRRLPPLTVSLAGIVDLDDTVVVEPAASGTGALRLRGQGGVVRRNAGIPSIIRLPRSASGTAPGDHEGGDAAALRVDPRVSLTMEGVGVRVDLRSDGPTPDFDVGAALRLPEDLRTPPWRHAFLDRCSISGGVAAAVSIRDDAASGSRVSASGTASRGRRATRYALRDATLDAVIREAAPVVPSASSRCLLDLALTQDTMIDVRGGVIFEDRDPSNRFPLLAAGILVNGGSLLVRSVSIHLTSVPRPTVAGAGTSNAVPDGQDIFIDSGPRHEVATHATLLHIDSQGWWFLGSRGLTVADVPSVVCVLNVGAGNVNWPGASNGVIQSAGLQLDSLIEPPSIAWAGGETSLLIEGSSFHRYNTIEPGSQHVVAAGATFGLIAQLPAPGSWWLQPEAIPPPGGGARPTAGLRSLVPRAVGLLRESP